MRYDAILIDADDTLLDFHTAEQNAIGEVISFLGITDPEAAQIYRRLNQACWADFEAGKVTQDELRVRRFRDFLGHYGMTNDPRAVGERYTEALARQGMLLEGALEAVRDIAARLPVAVVTNGISRVQHGRIDASPLRPYISALIISGEMGFQKPDPRMIFAALEALGGTTPERALMVGDSLNSDMLAANRAGVDACWYNPQQLAVPQGFSIRWQIRHLRQLPAVALQEAPDS